MIRNISLIFLLAVFSVMASAANNADVKNKKVRYKSGKRIDFQSLLIEGEKKKADFSVVTGNLGEKDFGLLKLRQDFVDSMQNDAQEEIQ